MNGALSLSKVKKGNLALHMSRLSLCKHKNLAIRSALIMPTSMPLVLIIAWVVFFGFINTHQRHVMNFRGASQGYLLALQASMLLGSLRSSLGWHPYGLPPGGCETLDLHNERSRAAGRERQCASRNTSWYVKTALQWRSLGTISFVE